MLLIVEMILYFSTQEKKYKFLGILFIVLAVILALSVGFLVVAIGCFCSAKREFAKNSKNDGLVHDQKGTATYHVELNKKAIEVENINTTENL